MKFAATVVVLLLTACSSIVTRHGGRRDEHADAHDAHGFIMLNGERTEVHWSDGDSFNFKSGPYAGHGTRLVGYNTLEAFGPVHRWGGWSREELFDIAKQGADFCASKEWECTTDGSPDSYGRVLVDCPKLAIEIVRAGQGLAYGVDGRPPRAVLDAMHQAQRAKRGLWKKGVPHGLITSLHSMGENSDGKYKTGANRLLDTATGETVLRKHTDTYQTCQEVCLETQGDSSCMVYVPFDQRYKNQPACLVGE